jgi:hypothetical protein
MRPHEQDEEQPAGPLYEIEPCRRRFRSSSIALFNERIQDANLSIPAVIPIVVKILGELAKACKGYGPRQQQKEGNNDRR